MTAEGPPKATKNELRRRMRALRRAIPVRDRLARSEQISAHLQAAQAWRTASVIALYASLDDEVQTASLVAAALSEQRRVALPAVVAPGAPLEFREITDPMLLVRGAFGVPEPAPGALRVSPDEVDLVVIPALAVDPRGVRLGYGGGYYDRTLPLLLSAQRIALIFSEQLVDHVPADELDVPVHAAVTEAGLRALEG